MASTVTETKRAPVEKISDVDLLALMKAKKVFMFMDAVKQKDGSELYSQELRWTDTNTPLLTKMGLIDGKGTIIWGPQEECKRNIGKFSKPNSAFDELDIQLSTKESGTIGELMHYYNDVLWKEGVRAFAARTPSLTDYVISPNDFCRKKTGTKEKPATAEQKAAFIAAANFNFTFKLKILKRDRTGKLANYPIYWELNQYVLDRKGNPTLKTIKVNSQNVHNELPRNSLVSINFRLGNCTRKDATIDDKQYCSMYAAFNVTCITMLRKGNNSGVMAVSRTPEEIRELLASSGVDLTYEEPRGESDDEGEVIVEQDVSSGSTGDDIAKQFANLST